MHFYLNEIRVLASLVQVSLANVSRPAVSANGMADSLAKHGVDRSCNLSASVA